mgnify:FL=1
MSFGWANVHPTQFDETGQMGLAVPENRWIVSQATDVPFPVIAGIVCVLSRIFIFNLYKIRSGVMLLFVNVIFLFGI